MNTNNPKAAAPTVTQPPERKPESREPSMSGETNKPIRKKQEYKKNPSPEEIRSALEASQRKRETKVKKNAPGDSQRTMTSISSDEETELQAAAKIAVPVNAKFGEMIQALQKELHLHGDIMVQQLCPYIDSAARLCKLKKQHDNDKRVASLEFAFALRFVYKVDLDQLITGITSPESEQLRRCLYWASQNPLSEKGALVEKVNAATQRLAHAVATAKASQYPEVFTYKLSIFFDDEKTRRKVLKTDAPYNLSLQNAVSLCLMLKLSLNEICDGYVTDNAALLQEFRKLVPLIPNP